MAEFVLKGAQVWISTAGSTAQAVNHSDHVREVRLTYSVDLLDRTAMGSSFRKRIAGLKDWNVSLTFNNDFAATKVAAALWPMIGSTGTFIAVKPTSAAVAATNPRYEGPVLLPDFPVIDGAVGALASASVTFQGNGQLVRDTA